MTALSRAQSKAKNLNLPVVFPEHDDPRIQKACQILSENSWAQPLFLNSAKDPESYVDLVLAAKPKLDGDQALALLKSDPTTRAAAMVADGQAAAMIAGAATQTAKVIRAALATVGTKPGVGRASSFFLMSFPDGNELVFADCAVNPSPDAKTLADIAVASAANATALLSYSRVALLSYSTIGSGAGPSVDLVAEAVQLLEASKLDVTGPVQADAALNVVIGQRKGVASGKAFNTLVFPNLDAGNIGYKLCQELAGAQASGPFLQGFAKPICDLSRGASVEDIVNSTVLTIAMSYPEA